MQNDKRWGGKRRPRITIPRAIQETRTGNLFKVVYEREGKKYYRLVASKTPGQAVDIAIPKYSDYKFESVTLQDTGVLYQYDTYEVRYRGEHQDLLRSNA